MSNNIVMSEEDFPYEYVFHKDHKDDKVYSVTHIGYRGEVLFSFDKKTILNLWTDYPDKFTDEQKAIFDKEQPFWADFFKSRCK